MRLIHFFDKLEDRIRGTLSRSPILYGIIGGTAIVLFWRGVWHLADLLEAGAAPFPVPQLVSTLFSAPVSTVVSALILLATGLFVSFFIGDRIILSGLTHEKKVEEKTEAEVRAEAAVLADIHKKLERLEREMHEVREEVKKK
ncbi:MAG TPA: hypothetical protein VJJ55_01280 [Candidatus Paceibacterota bacterium]